jgi:hypothetical protein
LASSPSISVILRFFRPRDDSFNIHNADAASVQNCASRSRDLDRVPNFPPKLHLKFRNHRARPFTVLIPRPRRIEASSALPPRKSARSIPRIVKELPIDAWANLILLAATPRRLNGANVSGEYSRTDGCLGLERNYATALGPEPLHVLSRVVVQEKVGSCYPPP